MESETQRGVAGRAACYAVCLLPFVLAPCAAQPDAQPALACGPWHVVGPFDWCSEGRLFWGDRPLAPEEGYDAGRRYPARGGTAAWREVPDWNEDGRVYGLASVLDVAEATQSWAACLYRRVDAPAAGESVLYLGFDDGLVLRVNGERLFQRFFYRDTHPRQEAIPVRLREGRNDFLLKIANKDNTAPSSFCFDLRPAAETGPRPAALPGGIGAVQGFRRAGERVFVETASGTLELSFCRDAVLRATFVPEGVTWPYPETVRPLPVAPGLEPQGRIDDVTQTVEGILVRGRLMQVEVRQDGRILELTSGGRRRALELRPAGRDSPEGKAAAALHLAQREGVFGMGSRYDAFNRRGRWNAINNTDRAFGESHLTLPFFVTQGQDALFFNSFGDGGIAVDTEDAEDLAVCRLDEAVTDVFYFRGTPKEIAGYWAELTGYPARPPRWALGVWMSRNSYENEAVVLDVARKLRDRRIPADVLVLEAWRGEGNGWMEWDPARWPDPQGLCRTLHEMGFKIVLWTMQYFPVDPVAPTPRQQEALDRRLFLEWDGKPWGWEDHVYAVDFSNPAACAWWTELHRPLIHPVTGADALKTDIGENVAGMTRQGWANVNQRYALDYVRCNWEMTRDLAGEGIVFARTGTVGTQRYPIVWAGDHSTWFQGMQEACNAMLSLGLAGHAWTSFDVGGLYGDLDRETYVRMVQLGAFCPIMQAHGQGAREPYAFDEETVGLFNRYAGWYKALEPYRVQAGEEAARTGVPIVRPLWMEFPGDPQCYEAEYQYFLGTDILVAPVVSYSHERTLYLPEGAWVDWWTGASVTGARWLKVDAPLERMPIYVRPGSPVLTMAPAAREQR